MKVGVLAALAASPLLSVACGFGLWGAKAVGASTPEGATAASNAFGFDLSARLAQDSGNLICSPLSAAVALNMASAGAGGATRAEMLAVLHVDPQRARETHASFGGLLAAINRRDGTGDLMLHVADQLWGQSGFGFNRNFLALLRDSYGAPLEKVDFQRAPGEAAAAINHWVAAQTHDRIPQIVGDGDLKPDTRLVLTNAVYFKGKWDRPFAENHTRPQLFAGVSGGAYVPTMAQEGSFAYAHKGDVQVLELTYGGDLSMVVVLPDDAADLPAVERKLARNYADWLAALRPTLVDLWLPRWTTRSRLDLAAKLEAAGMRLAFNDATADFSGIGDGPLSIDKVLQEAFIEVNETGTEAAAATFVGAHLTSGHVRVEEPKIFHADHPFLYLIRDRKTGAVLFLGRVAAL